MSAGGEPQRATNTSEPQGQQYIVSSNASQRQLTRIQQRGTDNETINRTLAQFDIEGVAAPDELPHRDKSWELEPASLVQTAEAGAPMDILQSEAPPSSPEQEIDLSEAEVEAPEADDHPYWISQNTRKLHVMGACSWEARTHLVNRRYVTDHGASGWSAACKICFKDSMAPTPANISDDSEDSSESSSSTSSAKRTKVSQEASQPIGGGGSQ